MHFIEIPKLQENSDEKDMLTAWTEFLKDHESERVRSLEMSVEEIREAKDELVRISNNQEQRELYEMRAKILKDKVSALNEAERKGINKGKFEVAKNLLNILDDETIAKTTGLSIDEIKKIRENKN
ncbi:MAG: Rpn family recombination-promoting nuclease/putative transposase [Inconstantimicrobium porci]|uniref:Rpn family recombination-promoting nuclease/putative transposase n=1 Tax=Inconstantimicrobium porci TaxID=2652291 RepID=UPI002A90DE3B|nr:Rpn family recombination-promoting nuclease/putative transposase [Inconstantimicrobium porci]MDY5911910.1 Rpn family recombination-promoting nuclease/putative transposase [Inconstantimicrobium porci]